MNIGFHLRQLLRDEDSQEIVRAMYKRIEIKGKIWIPLIKFTDAVTKTIGFQEFFRSQGDDFSDSCYDSQDYWTIRELSKIGVINVLRTIVIDSILQAEITIQEPEFIKKIYKWSEDQKHGLIVHYGIFSLNTYTGETYCGDVGYMFQTHRGMFRVLEGFIVNENHEQTYEKILSLHSLSESESESDSDKVGKDQKIAVHQIVDDIKERLGMRGEYSTLFVPTGTAYRLHPGWES